MKKILVSPGFGAGWSTWNSGDVAKYMLTYKPIIDYLESGGRFPDITHIKEKDMPPLLKQLQLECKEKFGEDYVCVLGADDLVVKKVKGKFIINEYDGCESIQTVEDTNWMEA